MNNRLIYKKPDGHILVVIPVDDSLTLDQVRKRLEQASPDISDCEFVGEVSADDIPQDREFRNCWRHDGSKVFVHPELEAAERWARIRVERNKLLIASDGLMARANEIGQKADAWKAYRQALRDISTQADPKNIIWPELPK